MTNIRECLEKWIEERCTTHAKLNEYRTHLVKEAFEGGYQAAHEAQQKRIDELEKVNSLWVSKSVEREKHLEIANNKVEELSEKLHIYLSGNLITLDTMLDNDKKIASLEANIQILENTILKHARGSADKTQSILTLEARCKELEDALTEITYSHDGYARIKAEIAISTKSPTETLDGVRNEVIDECVKDLFSMVLPNESDRWMRGECVEQIRKLKRK